MTADMRGLSLKRRVLLCHPYSPAGRATKMAVRLIANRIFPLLLPTASRGGVCRVQLQPNRLYHPTRYLLAEKKYTKKHEWISVEDGVGTVGVSNHAQEALGDIVYVQLPEVGTEVTKDVEFAALESVKAASDIYAPASGEVVEVNSTLEDEPGIINSSPEDEGWMAKIKLSTPREIDELLNEQEYLEFLKSEEDAH